MDLREQLQTSLGDSHTIERELGGGGMSRVFVAEETALHRRIVVKVLPPEMAVEISVARFQREIALVARLQHPHIVPLLAAGETDGLPYYTMPLVEGETLRARLTREGELPVPRATRLLREIASALAYAHEKGVVHRDVKPENVLVTGDIALVTDFGVAKALAVATLAEGDGLTATGIALGTPAYMAPEQAAADPSVDYRADIYAFGVVAYEMLAGQPPFSGRTAQGLIAAHLTESPESLAKRRPAIPVALAALVMRCLEKRPADRPQNAIELVHALDALATPTPTSSPPRAASRRVSRAVLAAIALVVVATAGGAWWRFGRHAAAAPVASSRLLIVPFENLTGDKQFDHFGRLVADRLTQGIAQQGAMDVVPSTTVFMSLRDTTGGEAKRIERLSAATHAGMVLSGTIVRRLDSLVLQGQVIDVRTGKVVVTLDPAAAPTSDPVTAVDALGDRLLGALGPRDLVILPMGARAPKYAAYREFAAGFERFAVQGDNFGSRPFFERAIALDSNYTRAYLLLSRQYLNAGEDDRADSLLQRIERLPLGLHAVERLQLDYNKAELNGDIAGLLRTQQQLALRDSNALALSLSGEAAMGMLRPDLAIPALERADPAYQLLGRGALGANRTLLAEAYHEAGAYDRENDVVLRSRETLPLMMVFQARQLNALAGLRRGPNAVALADSMLRIGGDSTGTVPFLVSLGAQEFRAHGDTATAARLFGLIRAWAASHPIEHPMATLTMSMGVAMMAAGMHDSAAARFALVARDTTLLDAAGYLVLANVARGDRTHARAIADSLGALRRRWLRGTNTFWRAAIVGALGDRELAVQLLRQAHSEGRWMQAWHYTTALESLHGFPPFEELIRPRR